MDDHEAGEPTQPEVPPARQVGTVLVGCFVLAVFAVIALLVLSVIAGAAGQS